MGNLKFSVVLAVFGLILSFLTGLISGVAFGIVFLRAFISAVICFGIAFLSSFIYTKFLADGTAEVVRQKPSSGGSVVDVKIDEDGLPDSENAPNFYVSRKYNIVDEAPKQKPVLAENESEVDSFPAQNEPEPEIQAHENQGGEDNTKSFVPKPLVDTIPQENVLTSASPSTTVADDLDSLDELPDFGGLAADEGSLSEDVVTDSDFAVTGRSASENLTQDINVGTDSSLMADAIRTLLKREG